MDYFEYKFKLNSPGESEVLIALLSEKGFTGYMEEDDFLKAYISVDEAPMSFEEDLIKEALLGKELVRSRNWNEIWEKSYDPVVVDDIILIRTSFHKMIDAKFDFEIIIDPKMSFGTGHHETTSVMLSAMLEVKFKKKRVADIGCGTGVLSIFASMRGADHVDAIDIDEWAVNNTLENLSVNKITNVFCVKGEINKLKNKKYDIILANINRNIHLDHMSDYEALLASGGLLLMSGIYSSDITLIKDKAEKYSFTLDRFHIKNSWAVTLFKKNAK